MSHITSIFTSIAGKIGYYGLVLVPILAAISLIITGYLFLFSKQGDYEVVKSNLFRIVVGIAIASLSISIVSGISKDIIGAHIPVPSDLSPAAKAIFTQLRSIGYRAAAAALVIAGVMLLTGLGKISEQSLRYIKTILMAVVILFALYAFINTGINIAKNGKHVWDPAKPASVSDTVNKYR